MSTKMSRFLHGKKQRMGKDLEEKEATPESLGEVHALLPRCNPKQNDAWMQKIIVLTMSISLICTIVGIVILEVDGKAMPQILPVIAIGSLNELAKRKRSDNELR